MHFTRSQGTCSNQTPPTALSQFAITPRYFRQRLSSHWLLEKNQEQIKELRDKQGNQRGITGTRVDSFPVLLQIPFSGTNFISAFSAIPPPVRPDHTRRSGGGGSFLLSLSHMYSSVQQKVGPLMIFLVIIFIGSLEKSHPASQINIHTMRGREERSPKSISLSRKQTSAYHR